MSIQFITNATTVFDPSATIWDFSGVTYQFTLDLLKKTLSFNGKVIVVSSVPSLIIINNNQYLQIIIPDNLGSITPEAIFDLNISISSCNSLSITGGFNSRTALSLSNFKYSNSFFDYSQNSMQLDGVASVINGPSIINVSQSSTKNVAILDFKNSEFGLVPNAFNSIDQMQPRSLLAMYAGQTAIDSIGYLNFGGAGSNPQIGILNDLVFQIENGYVNATFNNCNNVSGSNTNDIFVGGVNSKPTVFASSKGSDIYISKSGLDVLTFWDDFQGTTSGSYPTILIDLNKNYDIDGYGNKDQIFGIHRIYGSVYNPFNIISGPGNNFFWLYGNNDFVDGGAFGGIQTLGFNPQNINVDLLVGTVTNSNGKIIANFKNINSIVVSGLINVTCNNSNTYITVLNGEGGNIKGGKGDDNLFLTQNLLGANYSLNFDGGGGVNYVYVYCPYSEAIIKKTTSITTLNIGNLNDAYSTFLNGDYPSVKNEFDLLIAKGTFNFTNVQYINFVDGVYNMGNGIFTPTVVDFSIPNSIVSNFYNLNVGPGTQGYPTNDYFPAYLGGQDVSVDQTSSTPITVGSGNDNIVSRFNNPITTGDGNNYVMVIGSGVNINFGNGQNKVVITNSLTQNSNIVGGTGFNILEFNSPTVYQQSWPFLSLKNISAIYVPTLGYKFLVPRGAFIDFPSLINFSNLSNSLTAQYFDFGPVSLPTSKSLLVADEVNNTYTFLPVDTNNFINITPTTQSTFSSLLPLKSNVVSYDQNSNISLFLGNSKFQTLKINANLSQVTIESVGDQINQIGLGVKAPFYTVDVARFQFSDVSVAYDLTGNAGGVAKIIGAVFGKSTLANKTYVGIGLNLLDSGVSMVNLATMAMSSSGATTPDQEVSQLWTNVMGSTPTASDKAPFLTLLSNGTSVGDLAVMAANSSYNANNINLTGLSQSGIQYLSSG